MAVIEFWEGNILDVELSKLIDMSVSVKGKRFENPGRCLEVFSDLRMNNVNELFRKNKIEMPPESKITETFLPISSTLKYPFGKGIYQPPFIWEDSSPLSLAINFTYNTNAFYRLFSNLSENNLIPSDMINNLLDKACIMLSYIYKANDNYILRYINNNINMYILSKIVERIVGKVVYNSDFQEPLLTTKTLAITLETIAEYMTLTAKQKMALALGRGVAFIENRVNTSLKPGNNNSQVDSRTYKYIEGLLAIDDRDILFEKILTAKEQDRKISMCVILDDTSESVFDLLWMQQLVEEYSNFQIHLLLNTAQISINFSSSMLKDVLSSPNFRLLSSRINKQIFIHITFCPLISYQNNYFSEDAWSVINNCDFIYVKGMNFFETCQNLGKDTFYAFVVYGPISSLYTGLINYDAVFAFVPKYVSGYVHNRDHTKIIKLTEIIKSRK